ncbi:hypothetical protein [Streptomyces sp. NPDC055692]|uniref:hypothetical protein n=1 Tax=Streptomyces sp. NPDC055692 TaxID=3155683 RepID=UPI00341B2DBA
MIHYWERLTVAGKFIEGLTDDATSEINRKVTYALGQLGSREGSVDFDLSLCIRDQGIALSRALAGIWMSSRTTSGRSSRTTRTA